MPGDDLWFDDEPDDEEYPDEDERGEEAGTFPCPDCGTEVYEDAVQCPACGTYLSRDTNPWSGRPVWWILFGLLGIGALIYMLVTFPG